MNSLDTFKESVIDTIPIQREYRLYVYNCLGEILFRDKWEFVKVHDGESKVWGGLQGYLELIKKLYPNKNEELINYIFTYVNESLID